MSIRFLKLSLASPESIRSWTERVLPNGKRVGKILKGDLIDYKNGLPIRDGLSCERIFGPMVSFTCTCGRFKCIETRGIHIVHDTLRSSRPILPDISRQTNEKQFDKLESSFQNPTNLTNLETGIGTDPIISQNTISKPIQKLVSNQKPIGFPPPNSIPFEDNQQERDRVYDTDASKVPSKKKLNEPPKSAILQPIAYNKKKMIRFLSDCYYDYKSIYHFNKRLRRKTEMVPSFVSILEEPYYIMLTTKNSFKPQKVSYPLKKKQIAEAHRVANFLSLMEIVSHKNYSTAEFKRIDLRFKTDGKEDTSFSRVQNLLKPLYKFVFQIYTGFWFDLKMHYNNLMYEKHIFLWTPQRKFNTSKAYDNFRVHLSFLSKIKIQSLDDQSQKLPVISGILPRPTDFFNFSSLPRFLILSSFLAKIIRNNILKKTNPFFLKTTKTLKVHNNWYNIFILRDISYLESFFKGVNKVFIYWSQRNQKIELPYIFQFYIELKFSAAPNAAKIKTKADQRKETSFPAEPLKKYSQIIALYFAQQIKINHKAMFLEIPRLKALKASTSLYQENPYAYKPKMLISSSNELDGVKKNMINNIYQKLGLQINSFKKNVSTKNISNEISLLMQKPPQEQILTNISREKELDILFGSIKVSRFDFKQNDSNSLKNILSTFKKTNRKSQSRIWTLFQNSAFYKDRDLSPSDHISFDSNQKESSRVDENNSKGVKNKNGLSVLSTRAEPRNKKNEFPSEAFHKKLLKPISIFDSFKKQENIKRLRRKFTSNHEFGSTKTYHLDRKKPVSSLDSQSPQIEEMFSPKDKTNIIPSNLTSIQGEDTAKSYVASNTKQNIRVYKFKNFPPEEIRYCPYCEVELLPNSIRRYRLGYIEFISPVTHIWYTASSIPLLLNLSKTMIEGIASCHEALSSGFPPVYKWSYNGESPTSWTFQMQPLKLPINSVPKITPINEILNYDRVKKSNSTEIIFGSNSTTLPSEWALLENYKKVGSKAWTPSFRIISHKITPVSSLWSENNFIVYEKRIKNPFIKNAEINPKEETTSWLSSMPAEGVEGLNESPNSQLLYNNSNCFNPQINMTSKDLSGSAPTYKKEETSFPAEPLNNNIFHVPPILEKETYRKKTHQEILKKSLPSRKSGINFPYLFWKDISYNFKYLWIFEYPFEQYSPKNNWFVPVSPKPLTLLRNAFYKNIPSVEETNRLSAKPSSKSFPNKKTDQREETTFPFYWHGQSRAKKSATQWINVNNQQTKRLSVMLTKKQTWPFVFNQYISSFINLLTRKSPKHNQHLFFPSFEKPAWSFYPRKLFIKNFSPFLKVSPYQGKPYLYSSRETPLNLKQAPLFFRKNKNATRFLKGEKRQLLLNTAASVFNISNEIMREFSFFNQIPKKVDSHYDLDTATDYEKKREWLKLEGFFEDPSNHKLPDNSQVNLEIDNKTPNDSFQARSSPASNQNSNELPHELNKMEEKKENDSESFDHLSLPLVLPFLGKNPDNIEFKSNYFNHENFHTDPLKFIIDLFTTQYIWDYTNLSDSTRVDRKEETNLNHNQDPNKFLDQDSNLELFIDKQQYNDTWNNVSIGYNDLVTSLSNIYSMPGLFYTNKTVQKKPPRRGLSFSLKKFEWDLSLFLFNKNYYETNFWPSLNRFYINHDNWFSKTYPFLPVKFSNPPPDRFKDVLKPTERKTLVLNEFPNMEIAKALNSKNNSLFLQEWYPNQINPKLRFNHFNFNGYHENYQNCFRKLGRNAYYFKLEQMTRLENAFLKNLFYRNKFQKTNFLKNSLLVFPFISTSIFYSKNHTNKIIFKTNQLKLNQNFTIGKKTCFLFGFYLNVYDFNFFTPYLPKIKHGLFFFKKINSFFSSIIKQHFISFPAESTSTKESLKILARRKPYKFFLSKENRKNALWPLKSNCVNSQTTFNQLHYNSLSKEDYLGEFNNFLKPFSQSFSNIEEFYDENLFYIIKKGEQIKRIRPKNNYQKRNFNNFDRALYKNIDTLQLYSKNTFQNNFLNPSFNLLNDGQITRGLKNQQKPRHSTIKLKWSYKKYFKNLQKNWSPFLNELKSKRFNQDVFFINHEWSEENINKKTLPFFFRTPNFGRKAKKQKKSMLVPSLRSVGIPVSILYDFTFSRSFRLIKNIPSLETKQIKNKNQWLQTFKILCIKKRLSRHSSSHQLNTSTGGRVPFWYLPKRNARCMALKKWTKNQNFLNHSLTKNLNYKSSWLNTTHTEENNHKAIASRFLFYKSSSEIEMRPSLKQVPLFFSKNKGVANFVKREKRQVLLNTNAKKFVFEKHEYSFKVESVLKQIVCQIPHQKFLFSKETKQVKQKLEPLVLIGFDSTKIEFFGSLKIYAKRKFLEIWHYQDQNFRNNMPLLLNRLRDFKLQTEKVPNKKYVYAKLVNGIFPLIKVNKGFLDSLRENNNEFSGGAFLKNQQFLVYPKRNTSLSLNIKDKPLTSYVFDRFLNSFKHWPYNIGSKQQKQLQEPPRETSLNHRVPGYREGTSFVRTLEQKLFPIRNQIIWFSFYQTKQKIIVLPWKKLQFLSKNMILTRKKKKISHVIIKSLSLNNSHYFNSFRLTKLTIEPQIIENLKHLTTKYHKNMICYAYAIETIQKKKRILLNSTIPYKSTKNLKSALDSAYSSTSRQWNPKYLNHIHSLSFKISCFSYFGYGCIASLNLGNKLVIQKKSPQGRYQTKVMVQKIPKQIPLLRCFQQASFVWKNTNVEKLIVKTPILSASAEPRTKNFETINYIQSNYSLNPRVINSQTLWAGSYMQIFKWGERGHIFDKLSSAVYTNKSNNSINHKVSNQFKNPKHNPTKNTVNLRPHQKIRFKNSDPSLLRTDQKKETSNISPTLNWTFEKLKQKDQTWKGNTNYYGCISQITSWGSDHGSWILFLKYIRANIYKGDQLLSSYFNKMTFQMMPRTGSIMLQQLLSQLILIPKPLDQNLKTNFISKDESVSKIDTWQNFETNKNKENHTSTHKSINKIDQNLMIKDQFNEYFHYNSSFFSKFFIPGKFSLQEKGKRARVYSMEHMSNPEFSNSGIASINRRFHTLSLQGRNSSIYYQTFSIIDGLSFFQKNLQKTIQTELYFSFPAEPHRCFFQKQRWAKSLKLFQRFWPLIKKPVYLPTEGRGLEFNKQFKFKLKKTHKFFRNLKNIIHLKNNTNDISVIKNSLYKHKCLKTNVTKRISNDIIGFQTCSQLFNKYVLSAYKIKKPIAYKRFKQIYQSYSYKPINNWYRLNNFFSYSQNNINQIKSDVWKPIHTETGCSMSQLPTMDEPIYGYKSVRPTNQNPLQVENIFNTSTNVVIFLNQIKKNQNSKPDYLLSDPSMLYCIPSIYNDVRILKLIYSLIVSFQLQFLSINGQTKQYNNWSPRGIPFQNNKELFNALSHSTVSNTSSKTINDYTTYKISNTYYHIYSATPRLASVFLNDQKCGRVSIFDRSKNRNPSLVPHLPKSPLEDPQKITRDPNQNPLRGGLKHKWWYSKSPLLDLLTKEQFIINNAISLNKYHNSLLQNLVWLRSYLLKSKNILAGAELFNSKPWLLKKNNNLSSMLSDIERKQNTTNGVFKSSSHQNDVENFYFSNQKIKIYNVLISPLEISKSWSSPSHQLFNFGFPTTPDNLINLESSADALRSSQNSQKSFKSPPLNTNALPVISKRWNQKWWGCSYVRPINHFISDIKPYSSTISARTEPHYFSVNESMNVTKNLHDSVYADRREETNNLQKNKSPQGQNNKYQNSLVSQFNSILPMNLETYKGQVESETLFVKLKEIGNYNLLMKKKNTLFKTLILKMNTSLSPLSSETLKTNQNQIQLTKTITYCIDRYGAAQKTKKAKMVEISTILPMVVSERNNHAALPENWNDHSIFEKKNLHGSLGADTIKTNILPLSFKGSQFRSITALEFFKTWSFLNFVHASHLDWFNNLQSQYQVYPTRVTQKPLLHGTSNSEEFNDNNSFSKFLQLYEYRKNFLLKKIFKQRVYLTQYKIEQSSIIHKSFITKWKFIQKIYQKQSAMQWIMPNIMRLFGFFNDSWGFEANLLLQRKINTFYDQEYNLNRKYEFKPFGPQIKYDSTYSNWKNFRPGLSFKPQFFHLRNTTIESFKNQTRFRLLTIPQIFDLQDQNNVLNRIRKNKIPINIFSPLVFSSSTKPFKKIITFPTLKVPEKQFFWGTRTIFDHKKYSLNKENLYDPSFSAGFKKSKLNEYFTPEIFNNNSMTVVTPIYGETYLNPDRPLSSETLFREENLKVSSSYKALLQKAKILEDYPVPNPNPIDSKSICLRLLNAGLPRPIGWNLQNTVLDNKLPSFPAKPFKKVASHNKLKMRTYFDTNKNTETNGINWEKPKNSNTQSYRPFIWDGNQNRFKNNAALYVPIDRENRLNDSSQIRKTTSKDVFSIRDQTKLSALQRVERSPENKTMTNINDGTSLFFSEKIQNHNKNAAAPQVPISEPKTKFFKNQEILLTDQNVAFKKKNTFTDIIRNPPRSGFTRRNSTFNYGRNLRKLRLQYLRNFRRLRFIEYLKATYIKPEWMILSLLPVLPPDLRPVIANPRGYITGDINTHYQNVIYRNNNIEKLLDTFWIPRKFYSKIAFSNHQKATISKLFSLKSDFYSSAGADYLPIYRKGPIKLENCYTISELFSKLIRFPFTPSTNNVFSKTQLTNYHFEILSKKPRRGGIQNNNREMLFFQAPIFFGKAPPENSISTRVYENINTAAFLFLIKKRNATLRGEANNFKKVVAAPFFDNKMKIFVQKPRVPVLNESKTRLTRVSEMDKDISPFSASLHQEKPYIDKVFPGREMRPPLKHVLKGDAKQLDWKLERLISPMFSKFTSSYFDFNLNTLSIDKLYLNHKTSRSRYNKIFFSKNKLFKSQVSVEQIKNFSKSKTGQSSWETIQYKTPTGTDKSSNLNKILIVNNEPWQKGFIKNESELRNNSFVPKYKNFTLDESRLYNTHYKPLLKLYHQNSFFGSNIGIATGYNQIVQALFCRLLQDNETLNTNLRISIKDNPVPRLEKNIIRTQALHDSKPLQEMQYSLQKAVDALIDNSQKLQSNVLLRKGRPLKSLSDNLKGKEGRFRQHLLGKRVDYSGRSVIVVGPDLKLYECGIPLIMALRLFQPFLILYLIYRFKIASLLATQLIQRKHPMVINLLKKFIETWPILLNRAPTLHRMNIQAFKIRLVQGKAILLHPLVCSSYNADFDGDQMGVHVPITQQARAESWKLLWSINNSISIASRQPLFLPSQDMVIGNYYLTAPPIDNSLNFRNANQFSIDHQFLNPTREMLFDQLVDRKALSASLIPMRQEFLNLNIKDETPSFKSSDLDQEFSSTNPNFSDKLIKSASFGRPWLKGFQKMNHYFFSLEEAYQYYLNTVYRFHINTPVWFRFCAMFETSEREKAIEIAIDTYGNTIYTTKYYEKQLKRNRILGKNTFYFSNYLNSQITQPISKPKSIKSLMFENSIQNVVANFNFSTSVFSKDFENTKTFIFNNLSLCSKANKSHRRTNFFSKDFPLTGFDDNQKKSDRNTFTGAYKNFKRPKSLKKFQRFCPSLFLSETTMQLRRKTNKAIISSSSQIIFNKNLRPIILNQIIRSTFGRIEFYYEAFHVSRS